MRPQDPQTPDHTRSPGEAWRERHAPAQFDFDAGHLALDFANVADWHASGRERDWLPDYDTLLDWAVQAGTTATDEAAILSDRAQRAGAAAELARAVSLGSVIYRIFAGAAQGTPAEPTDLASLSDSLREALGHSVLVAGPLASFTLAFDDTPDLGRPLWPVLQAAADLLVSDRLDRVRLCGGDPCNWLFLDNSKNRSRRWCDMASCGNRAKARRFYARRNPLAPPPRSA